jgi:hypothetical protein
MLAYFVPDANRLKAFFQYLVKIPTEKDLICVKESDKLAEVVETPFRR